MTPTAKRKPARARKETVARRGDIATRFGSKNNPGTGRKKGSKNKQTTIQLQAAREAFAPMAKLALDKGHTHLLECELDGCQSCQWWGHVAFQYHYGKPTQPIEFDATALRTELEALAVAAGKTVDELEREAHDEGLLIMSRYR